MLKKLLSIALLWATILPAVAQGYGISGRVCEEAESPTPLPLAKVQLLTRDSALVAQLTTGNNGAFNLTAKQAGQYIVQVSFLGYENLTRNVTLTAKKPHARLGDLRLRPSDVQLGEAQVTALSSVLTIKADTFVYSTKAMRIPPGSSLSVLIKNMPGLEMDKDGKLTFHGKEVGSILVNGKEFFGDNATALQNMPADAIEHVKAYEKTDEEKEFRSEVDGDKQTVLDLTVKKEYLASWNINTDAALGTNDRYMAKAFATAFTDRRRVALYGSVNNVSENQQADENGNWTSWSSPNGIYTYRSAGGMFSWDNGRKVKEAGYFKANMNARFTYNNSRRDIWDTRENFLPDGAAQYTYGAGHSRKRDIGVSVGGNLTWNIDSMNRVNLSGSYGFYNNRQHLGFNTSTYDRAQEADHPELGLLGDDVPPELRGQGIFSMQSGQRDGWRGINDYVTMRYTHLFGTADRSLNVSATHYGNYARAGHDYLTRYLYFRPDAPRPELLNRQYSHTPSDADNTNMAVDFASKITGKWKYKVGYTFLHRRNEDDRYLYQLDQYDRYGSMLLPVGARPSTADSLEAVINAANSYVGTTLTNTHKGEVSLMGAWKKSELRMGLTATHDNERLFYQREGTTYKPRRRNMSFSPSFYYKWDFVENSQLTFSYYGKQDRPSLTSLLPLTDTSNEMQVQVSNPDLKDTWTNWFYLRVNRFRKKRGDSYNFSIGASQYSNRMVNTQTVDPVSGVRYLSKTNVDGVFSSWLYLGTDQPLDSARHWNLSVSANGGIDRDRSYIGADGDSQGLSTVYGYSFNYRSTLRWRQDIWSVALRANYEGDYSRYTDRPAYNETGHTVEVGLAPQVELLSGLRVSTDFCYYRRFGFADEQMNHTQWLWNANISQTFLRSKALTVQLEAVDILHQRTSERNFHQATYRYYSRVDCFLSYALLHVIYRFNLKGKNRD